jgi:hypothetical protein
MGPQSADPQKTATRGPPPDVPGYENPTRAPRSADRRKLKQSGNPR